MTPVDSGLGSIYSVALSNVTQPSSAPPCACENNGNKENVEEVAPSDSQSETKERAATPEVHSCKGAEPSKRELVTIETQTSLSSESSEVCPVLLVKPADSDSKEQCDCPSPENDGQQKQPSNKGEEKDDKIQSPVLPENDGKPESDGEKSVTLQPVLLSEAKHDAIDVNSTGPDSVPKADTPKLSVGNDEQTKANNMASPVFVTVSSEECDSDKALSISESLR